MRNSYVPALLILFFLLKISHSQTTRIFWAHETSYNGKVQSAELDGTGLTDVVDGLSMPCGLAIDDKSNPQKIYFCIRGESKIIRTNMDGSDPEEIITDVPGIRDIELDLVNRKIYWVRDTWDDDAVQRADMDGLNSNIEDLFTSSYANYGFYGIALDHRNQTVYWTQANNGCSDKIRRINFDGTGFANVITYPMSTLLNPWDIDVAGNKIYWTDCGLSEDIIYSANLDGTGIDTVVTEVDCQFFTIDTLTGKIYWSENNNIGCANLDGSERQIVVTGLGNFLMGIGIGYNVPVSIDENSMMQPTEFALKDNYPNPFNPSTTIEYSVKSGSLKSLQVELSIFNLLGQKIETLVSTDQAPGLYQTRWDAAQYAGGVYYSLLTVTSSKGIEFKQTKKMILLK